MQRPGPRNEPDDRYRLQRFVDAQAPVYEQVVGELRAGRKRTHWMWFTFPQIAGLGRSATSVQFVAACLEKYFSGVPDPHTLSRL